MIEREDVVSYTREKQDLQIIVEKLFEEMMDAFDLAAFIVDPRGYTRAFLAAAASRSVSIVAADAYGVGQALARKA